MKHIVLIIIACCFAAGLFAEWSVDPAAPNLIAGFAGEQVLPKVAIAPQGNTYICRFDNGDGSYKLRLNLLDIHGNPIWTNSEGLLVSSHAQMTWLTEYDLDVDADGNAVIVFQDIRTAGVNNVVAYKISPTEEFLWGLDGIALSADTSTDFSNMSPVCFCFGDNSSYFAWQRLDAATSIVINRLNATGQKLWGENGLIISPAEGSYNWPQIISSDDNDILLKYYQDTGPFWSPNRHIYVAKYAPEGTQLWNTLITDAGGIAAWQQLIPFESDGSGGAVLAWYDDRYMNMDNDVYCQRVTTAGNVSMPANGALVSVDPVNQQYSPKVAVDAVNQQIYVFYRVTDADQNNVGLARQLLGFSGNRIWGDVGPAIIAIGAAEATPIGAYYVPQGAVLLYTYGDDVLYASCWKASGDPAWLQNSIAIATSPGEKYHFDYALHPDAWSVLVWEQGFSAMDIFAMRINGNGSLGAQYLPPRNLFAELLPPNSIVLNWQPPSPYVLPDEYCLFMNNELVPLNAGEILTHTVSGLSGDSYEFYVQARYGDHYSEPSNTVLMLIVSVDDAALPAAELSPRLVPNPFSASVKLSFAVPKEQTTAQISIYNAKGQKLTELQRVLSAGYNELNLDPLSLGLRDSGVFFIRLSVGSEIRTVKGLFIK